ncbi:MAG: hypothetical protein NTY32_14125 [Bacteroidia bacterium]|nr:hypothetical protein [Bacteroidia bacterium]
MTEKQIERIRARIAQVKRALAADKKEWGGYYHDGSGIRYMCPGLYLKIRDFKGALNYFRWFEKIFPEDICYGEFYVEWAITLFESGRLVEAGQKVVEGYERDSTIWNKFLNKKLTLEDETVDPQLKTWLAVQQLNYSASEAVWNEFAIWLEGFLTAELSEKIGQLMEDLRDK